MTVGRHGRYNFPLRLPRVRTESWPKVLFFWGGQKSWPAIRLEAPGGTGRLATKCLLAYDLAVTTQILLEGRVSSRPEGPPNLYQLRGRWEWVTLLVENRKSKIENRKSKIENRKSKIENRKSKIENRKSKIENRKSKIKNQK